MTATASRERTGAVSGEVPGPDDCPMAQLISVRPSEPVRIACHPR